MTRLTQTLEIERRHSERASADRLVKATSSDVITVQLVVESAIATSGPQPVTVGVPWPRGVLHESRSLSLVDSSGHIVPLQTTPLSYWSDRSVQWLLVDFLAGPSDAGRHVWKLELTNADSECRVRPATQLRMSENEREIAVDTGRANFTLDRATLAPITQVEIGGVPVLDAIRTSIVLTDAGGRARRPSIERCEIEASGPVRTTVKFDGVFEGRRRNRLHFCARLSFFAGTAHGGASS